MDDYPEDWNSTEISLWEKMVEEVGPSLRDDWQAKALFDTAFFADGLTEGQRDQAREWLDEYFDEVYDVDFDDVFDWEEWREWYG